MFLRQRSGDLYNYPEHQSWFRRALWRLGFDPLTVYERLQMVRQESAYWKGLAEA